MKFVGVLVQILLLVAGSWAMAAPSRGRLVSTSVGQLRDQIVTSREVNANFFVETLLFGKKKNKFKSFYGVKSPEFAREVTAVLLEWVVFKESKGFAVANVSKSEMDKAIAQVWANFAKVSAAKKLQMSKTEVSELVKRKLRAKKFVRFKVDSSVVPITDDEAEEYFKQNRLKFGNLPFENFKENIKSFLGRQQIDRRLKDWFDVLQSKYKVRNFLAEID